MIKNGKPSLPKKKTALIGRQIYTEKKVEADEERGQIIMTQDGQKTAFTAAACDERLRNEETQAHAFNSRAIHFSLEPFIPSLRTPCHART